MLLWPASLSTGALARVQLLLENGGKVRREAAAFLFDGIPYLFGPYLSVHPFVHPSVIHPACFLSICILIHSAVRVSIQPSPSIYSSFLPFVLLFIYPSVCISVCTSMCLSVLMRPFIHLFIHISVQSSLSPVTYPSVPLSVHSSIFSHSVSSLSAYQMPRPVLQWVPTLGPVAWLPQPTCVPRPPACSRKNPLAKGDGLPLPLASRPTGGAGAGADAGWLSGGGAQTPAV